VKHIVNFTRAACKVSRVQERKTFIAGFSLNAQIFRILCSGRWSPEQARARYDPAHYILPSPHEVFSLSHWQKLLAANDEHLFNGQLFRLENYKATAQRLELGLGHTCYRDQIYCNAHVAELVRAYGETVLARGLGVSAIIITSDDYLPMMRRSAHVGEEPGKLDVFGGHAHPDQHLRNGRPDLFAAIEDEVVAELNVSADGFASNFCCGLVENLKTHKPDLVFVIHVRNTRQEVEQLANHAAEAEEMTELLFLPNSAHALNEFIASAQLQLTPSALASLSLFASTFY